MNNYGIYFTDEIWIDLNCFNIEDDRYMISTYGNVLDCYNNRLLSLPLSVGYPSVKLSLNDGARKLFYVHKLMGEAFLINDDPISKKQIDHNDSCRTNNFITNLEHVTQQENQRRQIRSLKNQFSENGESGNFKFLFTDEQVHSICQSVKSGKSYAEALEIIRFENTVRHRGTVSEIITGKRYKDIAGQYGFHQKRPIEFK